MVLFSIPNKTKRIWNEWNLRGAVLFSLFLQILLIFLAPSRKHSGRRIVTFLIWGNYLLADWVAAFAVGLIFTAEVNTDHDKNCIDQGLAVFWAPFLLLHLGGPDTITAFSVEDNELWVRHLLGLLFQLVAVVYVFSQSFPNEFWIPTVVFFVETIKYAEKTRALFLACSDNFNTSLLPNPINDLVERYREKDIESLASINDIDEVQLGYNFYCIFKKLMVNLTFSDGERRARRMFFLGRTSKDAFRIMEVELNFLYDALYTKMAVVHCKIGYFFRFISFVLIAVSLERFASHHKHHDLNHLDIVVTYTLLLGAVGVELVALIQLMIFSDWIIIVLPENSTAKKIVFTIQDRLSFFYHTRYRWSQSVSQHSLMNYCLNKQKQRFKGFDKACDIFRVKDFIDEIKYPVEDNLMDFIFEELKDKALLAEDPRIAKEIYSAQGSWVLSQYVHRKYICEDSFIIKSENEEVECDEILLLRHIATDLCYFTSPEKDTSKNREFCKLLSDYMLYLLIMQPTMMSRVANIGKTRFKDACGHVMSSFMEVQPESILREQKLVCERLLSENSRAENALKDSFFSNASLLVKNLRGLQSESIMWEMMSRVWVE